MTENFNFHGPTTFVNRPVDTVIQDFQNTHTTVSAEQLAMLLRLVLASQDLPEQDREEAARLVHEVAVSEDRGEPAPAESKLAKLGRIVAKAADIATPAAKLVESVSTMFT